MATKKPKVINLRRKFEKWAADLLWDTKDLPFHLQCHCMDIFKIYIRSIELIDEPDGRYMPLYNSLASWQEIIDHHKNKYVPISITPLMPDNQTTQR